MSESAVEIKRHDTALLKQVSKAYRSDCWQISDEVAGAIAQVQKVVEIARESIGEALFVKDSDGFPTGEIAYLYEPKAFILVGSLREFLREAKVSKPKFGSFELFRRNLNNPEIITFDELYERARHIVEHSPTSEYGDSEASPPSDVLPQADVEATTTDSMEWYDDVPSTPPSDDVPF